MTHCAVLGNQTARQDKLKVQLSSWLGIWSDSLFERFSVVSLMRLQGGYSDCIILYNVRAENGHAGNIFL